MVVRKFSHARLWLLRKSKRGGNYNDGIPEEGLGGWLGILARERCPSVDRTVDY